METLNNGGTASLPLTPALQHPRQQALRRGLVVVPDGFSTPLALSVDEVVSLTSFHTCRESFKAASRRASMITNASLATCNSDQASLPHVARLTQPTTTNIEGGRTLGIFLDIKHPRQKMRLFVSKSLPPY